MERATGTMKLLDRYLGIPAVWLLGVSRRKRCLPSSPARIGLFKEACIGDTVLLAGIIKDLRFFFPKAKIVLFAGPTNTGIATMVGADEMVELPVTHPLRCLAEMRKHPVDLLLDFGQWPRINAIYSRLSRAGCVIGFSTPGQFRHYAYDFAVEHQDDRHELENFRALLSPLDAPGTHLPSIQTKRIPPSGLSGKYVVCHPWPGGTLSEVREWPESRWVQLIRRFREMGFSVCITGGRADRVRSESLVDRCGQDGVLNLAGKGDLAVVAGLLACAECVVSVNTGVMHLAAAVGVPTLGLNGPTAEHRWGPVGAHVASVSVPKPHGGYLNLGFEYEGQPRDPMEHIEVDQVWAKVLNLLTEGARPSTPVRSDLRMSALTGTVDASGSGTPK